MFFFLFCNSGRMSNNETFFSVVVKREKNCNVFLIKPSLNILCLNVQNSSSFKFLYVIFYIFIFK